MTAFDVVRFRSESGIEAQSIAKRRTSHPHVAGFNRHALIRTDERSCCVVATSLVP